MKRIVPVLVPLFLAAAIPVFSQSLGLFSDVPLKHTYADAIYYLQERGVLQGYEDGSYRPDTTVNRAEFVKIVSEAIFSDAYIEQCETNELTFSDVSSDEWFAPYVCATVLFGVVDGYPDGTFGPSSTINFVEAAKIISNANEIPAMGEYDHWYEPYVRNLADLNALPPEISSFDAQVTRGQMAEMIYRLHAAEMDKDSQTYEGIAGRQDAL